MTTEPPIRFICGNCGARHASFSDALGDFLAHAAAGEYVKDWVEIPISLLEEKHDNQDERVA